MAGKSIAEREAEAIAEREAIIEADEEKLREACTRVALKALRHLEVGFDRAVGVMEAALERIETVGLTPEALHESRQEFTRAYQRMMEVSGKLAAVALARVRKVVGADERVEWVDLVDRMRGPRRIVAPREIVVVAEEEKRKA